MCKIQLFVNFIRNLDFFRGSPKDLLVFGHPIFRRVSLVPCSVCPSVRSDIFPNDNIVSLTLSISLGIVAGDTTRDDSALT